MPKTYLNPSALFPSQQYGFSQGVAAVGKTTLYVSGQVGWNAAQQITDPTDLGAQTRRLWRTLRLSSVRPVGPGLTSYPCVCTSWANTSTTPDQCARPCSTFSRRRICRA